MTLDIFFYIFNKMMKLNQLRTFQKNVSSKMFSLSQKTEDKEFELCAPRTSGKRFIAALFLAKVASVSKVFCKFLVVTPFPELWLLLIQQAHRDVLRAERGKIH